MTILTLNTDPHGCLAVTCSPIQITSTGLEKARQIISTLKETVRPLLPAAGLASTQIGLKEQVFVFSWDRSEENLCGAINPSFEPLGEDKEHGWEACFSTISGDGPYRIAYVPRYKKIAAHYLNEQGQEIHQILENFAARVFQHEYDHLQGLVNIQRPDAQTKVFSTRDELVAFTNEVKKNDQVWYTPPLSL